MNQIKEFISNAKLNNACQEEIDRLESLGTVKEIINHEDAPHWAWWYARNVIKGRWPEVEEIIKTSPEWAYFYDRDVINNHSHL